MLKYKKEVEEILKILHAECKIRKFTEYVLKNTQDSKGKNQIFYNLGFNIYDSGYLQK